MKKIIIAFVILFLVGMSAYFVFKKEGPQSYISKSFFKGDNQSLFYYGYANDGDNKLSGELSSFRKPQVSAVDGLSEAHAEPKDYRTLMGYVIAKPGPEARKNATASLDLKATSSFVVTEKTLCRYRLQTTVIPELENGVGIYAVFIKILDKEERVVSGSEDTVNYFIMKDRKDKILIFDKGKRIETLKGGQLFLRTDINPTEFVLQPGKYVLVYQVVLKAQAEIRAKVRVESLLDLI